MITYNMNNKKNSLVLLSVIILFFYGCYTTTKLSSDNLAYLYSIDDSMKLETIIYNYSDSVSKLYLKIIYDKPVIENVKKDNFRINYKLYKSYKTAEILDSATFYYSFLLQKSKIIETDIKAKFPGNYLLEVSVTNTDTKNSYKTFTNIFKSSEIGYQSFLIKTEDDLPLFTNYTVEDQKFRIFYKENISAELIVNYYYRNFPIALPPFSVSNKTSFDYLADSTYKIKLTHGKTDLITLAREGFYFFQLENKTREGVTLFRFYKNFPQIKNYVQMLLPLRYLTTKKEFNELLLQKDKKVAVEDFWIEIAGNQSRAKSLIRKYYNRVQEANCLFTSYLEGWKTDRGLIYIIFGQPNIVFRMSDYERWIYGEAGNKLSIKFDFVKVNNSFTDNDYSLIKSPDYKEKWYHAVNYWRR